MKRLNRAAARRAAGTTYAVLLFRRLGVQYGRHLVAHGRIVVTKAPGSTMRLGNDVVLSSCSLDTALGVSRPVILRTLTPAAQLIIHDDVGMSGAVICSAERVEVGEGSMLGSEVMIFDTAFHPTQGSKRRYAPSPRSRSADAISIGTNVFVGARVTILPGVTIGDDCVIGAGSVVVDDIPAGHFAAGNPCRVIRAI